MPKYPPQSIPTHGKDQHDSTVSKKRVTYISFASAGWDTNMTNTAFWEFVPRIEIDLSKFDHIVGIYLGGQIQAGAGETAYIHLYNITDSAIITGSEVSTAVNARTHVKSGDIKDNMPATAKTFKAQYKVSGGTGQYGGCYLMIEQAE